MSLNLPENLYNQVIVHLTSAYPNEGAGFLVGKELDDQRFVCMILALDNEWETNETHKRYKITPNAFLEAENTAEKHGLGIIGVFHSHPDHPARPSEYDRKLALPWFSYLIISIYKNRVGHATSWLLSNNRDHFIEELLNIE